MTTVGKKNFGGVWHGTTEVGSQQYTCGYCGNLVATKTGYYSNSTPQGRIYICPHCLGPTVTNGNQDFQIPGVAPGSEVGDVPEGIAGLYKEARDCVAASAYTGAVLCCRKLLMNIAVSQEAPKGKKFIEYVDYLAEKGYVPPNGKVWVDHIRKKGNEATHEIVKMNKTDAEELVTFAEMLLKFIYEFPNKVPKPPQKPDEAKPKQG